MFGWLFSAAVFGLIVAMINDGEFPGWGPMLCVVFAMGIAGAGVAAAVPAGLWFVGTLASAVVGAAMTTWLCHMPLRKSALASGIYVGLGLLLGLIIRY